MQASRGGWLALVFALGLGGVLAARAQDADRNDKALQGSWTGNHKGKKFNIAFDKGNFTVKFEDDEVNGTFKIDPAKTPRTMDLTVTGGRGAPADRYSGKTALAIYEVSGDSLKWCANEPGREERPQAFPPDAGGDDHLFIVFQREKK